MLSIERRYEEYWRLKEKSSKIPESENRGQSDLFETIEMALSKSAARLLDVGCGNGILMNMVKDMADVIFACDISKTAVKEAKKRGMQAICADLNIGYLPYVDEAFDEITCIEVIEHVLDPLRLLQAICRVLKPRGQLVLTTPNIRYFKNLWTLIFKGVFPHTTNDAFIWGGGHLHYFTRKDIGLLLRKAGFGDIRFFIAPRQFERSKKRRIVKKLTGESRFGEWFCNGIIVKAMKT